MSMTAIWEESWGRCYRGDVIEPLTAERWLTSVITNDATLAGYVGGRVFGHIVPMDATFPYVWFTHQAFADVRGNGPARIMVSAFYVVRACEISDSFEGLEPIANRIDAVLHAAKGTVSGGQVLGCVRERPFVMVDNGKGVQYRQLGGIYRLWIQ